MKQPTPFFFLALFAALFLAIFYNTVTNMAGIYIASDLGGGFHISIYSMVFFGLGNALSIPLANPLAERYGPIRLLIYCLLIYTLFSILCSFAHTFVVFNIYRFGLGLSSGPFYILSRRLLLALAPPHTLERYNFAMTLSYALVPVFGACFGAWLAYESLWRWIFHFNTPISLFLAAYFYTYLHLDSPPNKTPIDKIGYLFFALGVGALVTAATLAQQLDWYRSPTLVFLSLLAAISLPFFILWTLHHPHPILDLRLLRSPLLAYSLTNLGVLFSSYFGTILLLALWLNIYANYTPIWISFLLAAMVLAGLIVTFTIRRWLYRFDPRLSLACAILCFAISCYYSTYFDPEVDLYHLFVARFLAGLGLVLFLFPLIQLAFASHPPDKSPAIFTLFQFTRAFSSSLGAGLYIILWQRRQTFFHERLGELLTPASTLTQAYFNRAINIFHLTQPQATEQLDILLNTQATSLALNDAFGCMGYILLGLLALLLITLFTKLSSKPDFTT